MDSSQIEVDHVNDRKNTLREKLLNEIAVKQLDFKDNIKLYQSRQSFSFREVLLLWNGIDADPFSDLGNLLTAGGPDVQLSEYSLVLDFEAIHPKDYCPEFNTLYKNTRLLKSKLKKMFVTIDDETPLARSRLIEFAKALPDNMIDRIPLFLFPSVEANEPKLRNSQRHKERCRAIAALLWSTHSDITIADMAVSDAITMYGCEEKNYSERVIQNWIRDLHPDPKRGRPSKK
ncbi:hypothetical protein [Mariprofundus ferrooxydans]|uniref:hypothetical protein n=1 Tax=Mariprofundus ferrooxydans TaxID=314344 RepID=UPI0014320597|nr:hypothetical protein [Mariprofundus ferrooxydans]